MDWTPNADLTEGIDSVVTFSCSFLSVVGSVLVLISYFSYQRVFVKKLNTAHLESNYSLFSSICHACNSNHSGYSRAAYLIFHLAVSDLFWFLTALLESSFWLFSSDHSLPIGLCYIFSPIIVFTRMSSLMWTCLISYNVLVAVSRRSKHRKLSENLTTKTRLRYYLAVFAVAFPGTALNIAKKSSKHVEGNYGCHPGYESLGLWYEVRTRCFFIAV